MDLQLWRHPLFGHPPDTFGFDRGGCSEANIIDGKEEDFVPSRTNNCLETIFRFTKALLRRCTGQSKLPKQFGSIGALLPYYLLMRDHPTFREMFSDDRKLTEEFAKLFVYHWQLPDNLTPLPKKSENVVDEGQRAILRV